MRPRIRYCVTPAGRVAYSTAGAGPALLCDSGWITHLRGQLELYSFGSFMERLAEQFTVIRYDKPGCGLSDRDGIDLSFDGQVAAALAVADAVGAVRFRVFGASQGGQLAAAIAARHPDRVEALVLYGMCADGRDLAPAEVRESLVALVRAHWGLGWKALTRNFVTDATAEEVEALNRVMWASASAAVAAGCWRSITTPTSGPCSRRSGRDAGVANRVSFEVAPAAGFSGSSYDLAATFDCLHDMGDPPGAARHIRQALTPDGTWLVVEPYAQETVTGNLNPVGRMYYNASTQLCLPNALSQPGGYTLGAQAGEAAIRQVVTDAGFTRFRRAAETPFNLVYEIRP